MMQTVACREADSSVWGHSEKSIRESAPLLKHSMCHVHIRQPAPMIEDLGVATATVASKTMEGILGEAVVLGRRQLQRNRSSSSDPRAQQSANNSHNQYLRDSTDILLRKNSLIIIQSSPEEIVPIASNSKFWDASGAMAPRPMHRTRLFSSSSHHSPDHSSSRPHLIPSLPRTKQQHSNLVPPVLALLFFLAHCALSSAIHVDSPKMPTFSSDSATSTSPIPAHINNHRSYTPSHQPHLIQEKLNPIELKLLDHLIKQKQLHHRVYHHKPSRSAYGEHIFDPSSEEITLNLENSARTISTSQKRDIHESIEGMYVSPHQQSMHAGRSNNPNGHGHHRPHHHSHPHAYEQTMDSAEELSQPESRPLARVENAAELGKEIPKWLYWLHPARTHLTLGEAHALVKSVINNGLVEKLDFKTLEHLTRKYAPGIELDKDEDFIELHSETSNESADVTDLSKHGKIDKMTASKFDNEEPLNPEEELLTINRSKPLEDTNNGVPKNKEPVESADPKQNQVTQLNEKASESAKPRGGPFSSAIINEDLFKNYQNLEQVMEILMHSENTLKKRGEGPQLSIDSALTVLRERLLLELARRKAKATQNQIAINSEILKKLGRRRRSVDETEFEDAQKIVNKPASSKRSRAVNCDETKCNLHDLNSKWSNVHESLVNVANNYNVRTVDKASQQQQSPFRLTNWHIRPYFNPALKGSQQRFRNNDKYIAFDDDDEDVNQRENNLEVESQPEEAEEIFNSIKGLYQNRLIYSNLQSGPLGRIRINSRKPILSSDRQSSSARVTPYRRHSKMNRQQFSSNDQRRIPSSTWKNARSDDSIGFVERANKMTIDKVNVVRQME